MSMISESPPLYESLFLLQLSRRKTKRDWECALVHGSTGPNMCSHMTFFSWTACLQGASYNPAIQCFIRRQHPLKEILSSPEHRISFGKGTVLAVPLPQHNPAKLPPKGNNTECLQTTPRIPWMANFSWT